MVIGSVGFCFLLMLVVRYNCSGNEEEKLRNPLPVRVTPRRRNDILRKTMYKYFRNIQDFHDKLNGRWTPPKELAIPDEPMKNLDPFRPCQPTVDIEKYFSGESRDIILFSEDDPQRKVALNESCLYDGAIPVLICKTLDMKNEISVSLCFCSNDGSGSYPFVYSYNGSHCLGEAGSVCDGVKLNCVIGFRCDDGICGGLDGWIERSFAGQQIAVTEVGYEETARRHHDRIKMKNDMYLNSRVPPIRLTCNPRMHNEILAEFIHLLTKLNTTDFDEEISDGNFMMILSMKNTLLDLFIQEADSINQGETSPMGDEYNQNERCFDQFPRMSCVSDEEGLARGYCVCSNFSKYFHYTEVNGHCVAKKGSVCTIVRGSGDFLCEGDLNCETIGWHKKTKRIPNPLTHLEIKICGGWSALIGESLEHLNKRMYEFNDAETEVSNNLSSKLRDVSNWWRIGIVIVILTFHYMTIIN